MQKKDFIILGGGISGLTAARALQYAGYESVVLESCPSAGGLTRSIKVDDFCFDTIPGIFCTLPASSPHRIFHMPALKILTGECMSADRTALLTAILFPRPSSII